MPCLRLPTIVFRASGALVFKVDCGSINWWHPFLTAGQDHLSVLEDLSDLERKFRWAGEHPDEAEQIAELGRKKAMYFGRRDVYNAYHHKLLNRLNDTAESIFADFPKGFPAPTW